MYNFKGVIAMIMLSGFLVACQGEEKKDATHIGSSKTMHQPEATMADSKAEHSAKEELVADVQVANQAVEDERYTAQAPTAVTESLEQAAETMTTTPKSVVDEVKTTMVASSEAVAKQVEIVKEPAIAPAKKLEEKQQAVQEKAVVAQPKEDIVKAKVAAKVKAQPEPKAVMPVKAAAPTVKKEVKKPIAKVIEPVASVADIGDAMHGKKLVKKCMACHKFNSDKKKVGPGLKTVVGRKAGSMTDMKYGKSLKDADWSWDDEHLRQWLCDSKTAIKTFTGDKGAKTKMPKQKICGSDANDVIAYLKSL